jgi:hypothetical protein
MQSKSPIKNAHLEKQITSTLVGEFIQKYSSIYGAFLNKR